MRCLFFIIALFLFNSAHAEVLFHDPTGKALNAAIDKLSEKDFKDLFTPDASRKKFFLGLFYINGAPEFHIEKDCKKSVAFLQDAWKKGIADAGYTLSTMYYNGVCVDQDFVKSKKLATQAAEDGYILAQRMLGMAYVGENWARLSPYNVDKGIYWLSKAGNAGDGESAGQLSHMYGKGDGVSKDEDKYFYWLKKAVFTKYEKGNMLGMPGLANAYENGIGTKKDLVKAYKYYDLIGTAGLKGKQRIAKQMTQEQIDEAIRESNAWQKENNIQAGSDFIRRVK